MGSPITSGKKINPGGVNPLYNGGTRSCFRSSFSLAARNGLNIAICKMDNIVGVMYFTGIPSVHAFDSSLYSPLSVRARSSGSSFHALLSTPLILKIMCSSLLKNPDLSNGSLQIPEMMQ